MLVGLLGLGIVGVFKIDCIKVKFHLPEHRTGRCESGRLYEISCLPPAPPGTARGTSGFSVSIVVDDEEEKKEDEDIICL